MMHIVIKFFIGLPPPTPPEAMLVPPYDYFINAKNTLLIGIVSHTTQRKWLLVVLKFYTVFFKKEFVYAVLSF